MIRNMLYGQKHGNTSNGWIALPGIWNVIIAKAVRTHVVGYVIGGGELEVAPCRRVEGVRNGVAGANFAVWISKSIVVGTRRPCPVWSRHVIILNK